MILISGSRFKRAFKRLVKKNPKLQDKILVTLELLADNPFTPSLKSHKLTGKLENLWSCSVAYDCRIVYTFKEDEVTGENMIILVDIGSHDEVY
jgi:mRNA interferase YafQ